MEAVGGAEKSENCEGVKGRVIGGNVKDTRQGRIGCEAATAYGFGRQSMIRKTQRSKDPDILAADAALRRAARRARELGRKTGTPVYVLKNGRIVDLTKEWKHRSRTP